MASPFLNILDFDVNSCIQDLLDAFNECDLPYIHPAEVQELDEHKFFITLNQLSLEFASKNSDQFSMHLIDYYCGKYSKKLIIAKSCYAFYYCWKKVLKNNSKDARLFAFCCFNKVIPHKLLKFYCKMRKLIHSLVTDKLQALIPTINTIEINLEQTLAFIKKMFQTNDAITLVNQNLTSFLQNNKQVYAPKEKMKACLIAEFCLEQFINITLSYEDNYKSSEEKNTIKKSSSNQNNENYARDEILEQRNLLRKGIMQQQPHQRNFLQSSPENRSQEENNSREDRFLQSDAMKGSVSHSNLNLNCYKTGYQLIHNLKQSKSQSQITPIKNKFNNSSKSPLRKSSVPLNQRNKQVVSASAMFPTTEKKQNDFQQAAGSSNNSFQDQNFTNTLPIKRKSSELGRPKSSANLNEDTTPKSDKQLTIKNYELKSEIINIKNDLTKLKEENHDQLQYNQNLEQIFLDILVISIESDYRSGDVDKIIERYETIKKSQGDQSNLQGFRECCSQLRETAKMKQNLSQEFSELHSTNQNTNNLRNFSITQPQFENNQSFNIANALSNPNITNSNLFNNSPALKSASKKRSLLPDDLTTNIVNNSSHNESYSKKQLEILEEASFSLQQQINKNILQKSFEKSGRQDIISPRSITQNSNQQQQQFLNSSLFQNSFGQIKDSSESEGGPQSQRQQQNTQIQLQNSFKNNLDSNQSKKQSELVDIQQLVSNFESNEFNQLKTSPIFSKQQSSQSQQQQQLLQQQQQLQIHLVQQQQQQQQQQQMQQMSQLDQIKKSLQAGIPNTSAVSNQEVQQKPQPKIANQVQHQQQPFQILHTIESDIRTFEPTLSNLSSINSNHQLNQQTLHMQHLQNLLQRQKEKQDLENAPPGSFYNRNMDNNNVNIQKDHILVEQQTNSIDRDDSSSIKTFDPDNMPLINNSFHKNNLLNHADSLNSSLNRKNLSAIQINNSKNGINQKGGKNFDNVQFLKGIDESVEEAFADQKSISFRETPSSACGENIELSESEGVRTYRQTQESAFKVIKKKVL